MAHRISQSVPLVALVDAGATAIRCAILDQPSRAVRGYAEMASRGMQSGDVFDASSAMGAIAAAVSEAERAAGVTAGGVLLAVQGGRLASVATIAEVTLDPAVVTHANVRKLIESVTAYVERNGRAALHTQALGFALDGRAYPAAPLDRFGRHFEGDVFAASVERLPLQRLIAAAEACDRPVTGLVPAPLASGRAVTTVQERDAGIAVVDIGATTTSLVVYRAGAPIAAHAFAFGGAQWTAAVAQALQIPVSQAERIKTNCDRDGFAHAGERRADMHAPDGGSNSNLLDAAVQPSTNPTNARASLIELLSPCFDQMLRYIADRIDAQPFAAHGEGRVVVTGGASQLDGFASYAARILGRPVRLGRPDHASSITGVVNGPDMAVIAGLRLVAQDSTIGVRFAGHRPVLQRVERRA
jgi:cell division protein FtsA